MGISDMYCMSDDYLVQELIDEQKSNKINQLVIVKYINMCYNR